LFSIRYLFSKDRELATTIRNLTGVTPGNLAVYKLALSHRSIAPDSGKGIKLSNERLEYLGDAILGAVVADLLFKRFPYRDEGFLTEMRSRLVSREHLKSIAIKIGINQLVRKDTGPGSFRSMYGDAFEALIGAIYIDRGYNITKRFILDRIIAIHVDLDHIETTESNYKSKLLNWAQKEKHSVVFRTISERSSRIIKVRCLVDNKEVSTGQSHNKKKAEQVAAEEACSKLGLL